MVIYLDAVGGLNFAVDWLLLLGVNRLAGHPPGAGRTALAAMVGGGYAAACLVPGWSFLSAAVWRAASFAVMTVTAFGFGAAALRRGVLFLLLSMALGGLAVWNQAGSIPSLVLCAGALAALCHFGFRGRSMGRVLVPGRIVHGGKTVEFLALRDTGNALTDPLTGEPVLVVDAALAWSLLALSPQALRAPVQSLGDSPVPGMRLIPCRTVGGSSILLALRLERVELNGKRTGGLVAFSPEQLGNGEYQALTGGTFG